jgi:hypothetical protein
MLFTIALGRASAAFRDSTYIQKFVAVGMAVTGHPPHSRCIIAEPTSRRREAPVQPAPFRVR